MVVRFWVFMLALFAQPVLALDNPSTPAYFDLKKSQYPGAEWQLEVRQLPLAQALDAIVKQAGVSIHYSVLPEGLVTATCVGDSLQKVMSCLLNHKADLIVRYAQTKQKVNNTGQVIEAWVLGSKLDGYPVTRLDCVAIGNAEKSEVQTDKQERMEQEQLQTMLKMTASDKPAERAEAIGNLLAAGHDGDPEIREALEKGLHDQDANVRAQAVSTITHRRDYEQTASVIQEALKDSSIDVRMMAVDGIANDAALLQQAVNDSDEEVRTMASIKLQQLMQRQNARRK